MRLERLDLTRYGKFTDHSLDFGPRRDGKPDLHIVHGPNEAGKTTTLNAWLDLIYGMPLTTPYGYQHGYDMMRVGARIAFSDGVRDYFRIKRAKNSLLDGEGRPVSDEPLAAAMGGLNRAAYANMFSLDAAALEAGGREAVESRGQLGEMLFAASAGLGALSGKLGALRAQADAFWKSRARNTELTRLKAELAELRQKRDAIDTIAAQYATLAGEQDRCAVLYEEAIAQRGALEQRRDEIRRTLTALDMLPRLANLRERLAPLPDAPDAPEEWADQTTVLMRDEVELGVLLQREREALETATRQHDAIIVDETALQLEPRLEALGELFSRYAPSSRDIPKLRHEIEASGHAITALLRQMDRPLEADPSHLLLSTRIVQSLRELADQKAGIDARLGAARREHAEALASREAAEAALAADGMTDAPDAELLSQLVVAADAAREGAFDQRCPMARRNVEAGEAVLAQRMELLAPWSGEAAELAMMRPPAPSRLEELRAALHRLAREADTHADATANLDRDLSAVEAELTGIISVTGVADETEVARARSVREQAWAAHRSALDPITADTFEAAMRHDDMVAEARLTRQKELLRATQLRQQQETLKSRRAHLAQRLRANATQATDLREDTRVIAIAVSPQLAALDAPDALAGWLERRQHALNAREPLLSAQQELETAISLRDKASKRLAALLSQAGIPQAGLPQAQEADLASLIAVAERLRATVAAQRQQHEELTRAGLAVQARARTKTHEESAATIWNDDWSRACKACWLGDGATLPAPMEVRAVLDALTRLEAELDRRNDLYIRIGKMERDQEQFATAVRALAAQHSGGDGAPDAQSLALQSPDPQSADVLALHEALAHKAAAATAALKRRQELNGTLAATQARVQQLSERQAILNGHINRITQHFRVETLTEATQALRASRERRLLAGQIGDLEQQIVTATAAATMADADRHLENADRGALTAEAASLKAQIDDTDMRSRELFSQRAGAGEQIAAIGADASAAQLETQRRTVLLQIEESARRYLKLRLGVAAADQALAAWRDSHRSALLTQASRAFSHMSCGAWAGLSAQPGGDGEVLVAAAPDGTLRNVAVLSKGTRFQLYLALRIAACHEFAATRTPPPFIADDVMESFDDERTAATIDQLAGMALHGQVIYLTHHRHLCDIAARRCPDARVHELA